MKVEWGSIADAKNGEKMSVFSGVSRVYPDLLNTHLMAFVE